MKYVYVLNSFGNNYNNELYQMIDQISNELNIDHSIEVNSDSYSTEDILNKYKASRSIIVPVGGDGMINRVLNGIKGTNNILSFLPNGTGNDFARTVKETLSDGLNKVDVIRINNKYCINIACFGVDAEIANDDTYVHNTVIPKKLRYIIGVPNHFLNYNPKELNISFDDKEIENKFTTVVVCNARYYGSGIKVSPSSILNDSMMEVYLVDEMKKLDMVSTILSMKNGKHENREGVRKITTDNIFISSNKPIDINIDGEKYTDINFDINLIHNGIEVFNNQNLINSFEEVKKRNKKLFR